MGVARQRGRVQQQLTCERDRNGGVYLPHTIAIAVERGRGNGGLWDLGLYAGELNRTAGGGGAAAFACKGLRKGIGSDEGSGRGAVATFCRGVTWGPSGWRGEVEGGGRLFGGGCAVRINVLGVVGAN